MLRSGRASADNDDNDYNKEQKPVKYSGMQTP